MDREEIKELVKEVLGPNTPMIDQEKWVSICCPLSPFTHVGGKDEHPSAGISVQPGGTSIFNCFTCHNKGTVSWLLKHLSRYTGEDWGDYADSIERGEFYGGAIPEWGAREAVDRLPAPLDKETYLDLYDSAENHPYVRSRGISRVAARRMQLLHDPGDGGTERIVFPVYSTEGLLYGFTGRAVDKEAKLRVKDYYGLPKRMLLLGSHLILKEDEFVILVEGLFDYAKLVSYGYPAMAFMSSTLTTHQAEIVKDLGKPVYFFHDDDQPGIDARDNAKELLWRHVPLMKVRYPTECTVETPEGDLRPPGDPAELNKEQVEEMLDTALIL
jgi:hypothetical protein